jgi:hypothetical protein
VSFDNERYNRHMAECERRDKAADAVTDEAIGEYIREELLDEFVDEIAHGDERLSAFAENHTPDTYEKARAKLIERAMEARR